MSSLHTRRVTAPRTLLLALHQQNPERYPALLESTATSAKLGRYDILFAFPRAGLIEHAPSAAPFLHTLHSHLAKTSIAPIDTDLPFTGGWLIFLSYEIASDIEPTLRLPTARDARHHDAPTPRALALRIPAAIIHDTATRTTHLIAEHAHAHLLDDLHGDLERVANDSMLSNAKRKHSTSPAATPVADDVHTTITEDDPRKFLTRVRRAHAHITAGDTYQVNLSRAWHIHTTATPAAIYSALRETNPAPFAASLIHHHWHLASSSPERLLELRHDPRTHERILTTRPIAGTRPRAAATASGTTHRDAAERAHLITHPKERAEHTMLVDLARNDLGKVCQPGTVHVDELMTLESYTHVHHIVSNIRGTPRNDATPIDILEAIFPAGTITGCPKIRSMQLIADLEATPRGPYTGTLGYLNHDATGDFNILIRTMTMTRDGNTTRATFRTGAGIVADSHPERELAETRAKAEGLLRAIRRAASP